MHITNLRRMPAGSRALAHFDLQLTEHVRLYDLAIKRGSNGGLRVWAPHSGARHVASFSPDLAIEITRAAEAALEANAHVPR